MTEPLIGLATGIVMARRDCNPDEAFTLLTEAAQDYHVSVTELAECVLADLKLSSSRTHPPGQRTTHTARGHYLISCQRQSGLPHERPRIRSIRYGGPAISTTA